MKIDNRKNYYLTLDTETANSLDDPFVYNLAGAIHDKLGVVYATFSFIITDIFYGCADLMQTAYYAEKIPQYIEGLQNGAYFPVTFKQAKFFIRELCEQYNVKAIVAHNAPFDYKALNKTERYISSSEYRYFLPYGIPLYDTLTMARDTIGKQKSYIAWCRANDKMKSKNCPRLTAEILYQYLSGNHDFIEEHTALADVLIEKEIFVACMRQHKKMRKSPWKDA